MKSQIVLLPASPDDDLRGLLPQDLVGAALLERVANQCCPELSVDQVADRHALEEVAFVAAVWPLTRTAEELLREAGEKGIPRLVVVERAIPFVEMRALPADKVACIGRSQARHLEAVGNECEVVGIPGLDGGVAFGRAPRTHERKPSVVIWNSNREAPEPRALREWAQSTSGSDGLTVEFLEGAQPGTMARIAGADACLVTGASRLAFAMATGVPTALVCFSTWPEVVEPAWRVASVSSIDSVIESLLRPEPARMLFQETSLHTTLEVSTPALPRLMSLVQEMAGGKGRPWSRPEQPPLEREQRLRHEELYTYPAWLRMDEAELVELRERYIRFARNRTMPRLDPHSVRVTLTGESRVLNVRPSHLFALDVCVTNESETPLVSSGETPVHVSYHWSSGVGPATIFDGLRSKLDVPAGCTRKVQVAVQAPQDAGIYQLDVTLVQEGVFWFDQQIPNCAWTFWVMVAEANPCGEPPPPVLPVCE